MHKRGFYEIILVFFVIIVLIASVLFMLHAAGASSVLYASIQKTMSAPQDATHLKDILLGCHRITYLDAELLEEPCPADNLYFGYSIRQYGLNDCEELAWDRTKAQGAQVIPYIVAIEQNASSKKCLGVLEVHVGDP